jgi:hypothetical protein
MVNFEDFAVLADGWLTDYAISDLDIMADEWLEECSPTLPNITPVFDGDANNLSGYVRMIASTSDPCTYKVFALIDGEYQGELYACGVFPLGIETQHWANGNHYVKLISMDYEGRVVNSENCRVNFNNLLYIVQDDNLRFYHDRNYHYEGFYDGGGTLEVELAGLNEDVLWSNTYSGNYIDINIPGLAFGAEKSCELNMTNSSASKTESLNKEFKKVDNVGIKMWIIAPNKELTKTRGSAIRACEQACDARNVSWCYISEYDVNEGNLIYALAFDSTKFVYWVGHAESHIVSKDKKTVVQRTCTNCWRREELWPHLKKEIYVFSKTCIDPPLPDNWDFDGFDLWQLQMHDSWSKKIVFIDGCKSADFNDMAEAYGVYSLQGQGSKDQIYIGWRIDIEQAIWDKFADDTTYGIKLFWDQMRLGKGIKQAFDYTANNFADHPGMPTSLWGGNRETDLYEGKEGDDNIILYGLGFLGGLDDIKLEP